MSSEWAKEKALEVMRAASVGGPFGLENAVVRVADLLDLAIAEGRRVRLHEDTTREHLEHAGVEHEALLRAERAETEVARLKELLDRDRTGLAAALGECRRAAQSRWWIVEGRGSYEWDDERYRRETGAGLQEIVEICSKALAASGKLADAAFRSEDYVPMGFATAADAEAHLRWLEDGRVTHDAMPDDLRAQGWTVAVHNDYRLDGKGYTFWLVTKDGRALKGEGPTDADALHQIRKQLADEASRGIAQRQEATTP